MDEFDHPFGDTEDDVGAFTLITYVLAFALSLATCLLSLSDMSMIGPNTGEIVMFDPRDGPKHWDQPGIPTHFATREVNCVLLPSVLAADGGSFVIEAKQMTRPPVYRVHWSGRRTDTGPHDCGGSADLILTLVQWRALEIVAGGPGTRHGLFEN